MSEFLNAASESLGNAHIAYVFFLAFENSSRVNCSVNSAAVPSHIIRSVFMKLLHESFSVRDAELYRQTMYGHK